MRHTAQEFIWILLCPLTLSLLPWWQAVVIVAVMGLFLLRLTERGFRRRLMILFVSLFILFFTFHHIRPEIAASMSKLFKLPHYSILSLLSAGSFSVVMALAAESVLWLKFSFRRAAQKFQPQKSS